MDYCQIFSQIRGVVQFLQSIKANKSCESNKMEKNEFRAVIKYFYIKDSTPKETKVVTWSLWYICTIVQNCEQLGEWV